ncbi:MAG: homoserine kinase [Betaproteobacteria bacterium TMED82]|nr:MAG: homoserine kinase [Betaproteobacteria bacterium TMED82]|tara:strand:- start:10923 stop:11942 length:1020 start_codon:yes stop_codon:yes gene_type:complete
MAVFSKVSTSNLEEFLDNYDLGRLSEFEGIREGIENTNYFIYTTTGDYVLTLFEKLSKTEASFYLYFMRHLAKKRTPCPLPILSKTGKIILTCKSKPAAIVSRLEGKIVNDPTSSHCSQIGRALAIAHEDALDFTKSNKNTRGLSWWKRTIPQLLTYVSADQNNLLIKELNHQIDFNDSKLCRSLPKAIIHADLFRDNALFAKKPLLKDYHSPKTGNYIRSQDELRGIIDFYFAGFDSLIFDLAVCMNDWAIDEKENNYGRFYPNKYEALLTGYEEVRRLTDSEREAWPVVLRGAAFRFWISRLFDWFKPRSAALLNPKNPIQFERILINRQNEMEQIL